MNLLRKIRDVYRRCLQRMVRLRVPYGRLETWRVAGELEIYATVPNCDEVKRGACLTAKYEDGTLQQYRIEDIEVFGSLARCRLSAMPNVESERDGCLAQAVPSTDCDKQSASLHRMVRLI